MENRSTPTPESSLPSPYYFVTFRLPSHKIGSKFAPFWVARSILEWRNLLIALQWPFRRSERVSVVLASPWQVNYSNPAYSCGTLHCDE